MPGLGHLCLGWDSSARFGSLIVFRLELVVLLFAGLGHLSCLYISLTIMFQVKTTRMLLVVSTVFLMLNVPSHVFRVYSFIIEVRNVGSDHTLSKTARRLQEFCQLLYYLNFAINFFLYSFCAKRFRDSLRSLLSKARQRCVCQLQNLLMRYTCTCTGRHSIPSPDIQLTQISHTSIMWRINSESKCTYL